MYCAEEQAAKTTREKAHTQDKQINLCAVEWMFFFSLLTKEK